MPPLRAPQALKDAWDSHKTVKQNYARLGLLATLNPRAAGGSETIIQPDNSLNDVEASTDAPATKDAIPKGFGRIVRDAEGNIVDVEMEDSEASQDEEDEDPLHAEAQELQAKPVQGAGLKWTLQRSENTESTELIHDLENLSKGIQKTPRTASSGEKAWLVDVVTKYGSDFEAAARDRKLNPWQRTAGEIKRSVAKAGGLGKLTR